VSFIEATPRHDDANPLSVAMAPSDFFENEWQSFRTR
jgi:hypothetical protein